MLVTLDDFDWSVTDRELVFFMPSWGRGHFIRKTVETMKTNISRDRWIIVVGNDCEHEDLSDLKDQNVVYFTFDANRTRPQERGGAFIRNVAIKRSRSKWFFQKDPEIIIENDFIANILNCPTNYYRLGEPGYRIKEDMAKRLMQGHITIAYCKQHSQQHAIDPQHHVYSNFAFAVPTQLLQNIRGFDEDYGQTYYYDTDLFARLQSYGVKITSDPQCNPIHIWHPTPSYPNTPKTKAEYEAMGVMFASKDPKQIVRNPIKWGEGG